LLIQFFELKNYVDNISDLATRSEITKIAFRRFSEMREKRTRSVIRCYAKIRLQRNTNYNDKQ